MMKINNKKWSKMTSRLILYRKTAATRRLPIERALKTDLVSVLAVCQQYYSIAIEVSNNTLCY